MARCLLGGSCLTLTQETHLVWPLWPKSRCATSQRAPGRGIWSARARPQQQQQQPACAAVASTASCRTPSSRPWAPHAVPGPPRAGLSEMLTSPGASAGSRCSSSMWSGRQRRAAGDRWGASWRLSTTLGWAAASSGPPVGQPGGWKVDLQMPTCCADLAGGLGLCPGWHACCSSCHSHSFLAINMQVKY